jgi:crossover junction endodeoxyribonuclease RuvC
MDVCGIDPGLNTSGYAVVRAGGQSLTILDAGVCRTPAAIGLQARLAQLDRDFSELFEAWPISSIALEQLYAHYKHPRTAILMGHARGVIIAAAARRGIEVCSYSATQVKRFLTGNGRASKVQMQRAVSQAYSLPHLPEPHDVADALALAFGHAHSVGGIVGATDRPARGGVADGGGVGSDGDG